MRWASALAVDSPLEAAVASAGAHVRAELGGGPADLLLVFVSGHHAAAFDRVPTLLAAHCPAATVLGCSAAGVIGGGHEVENRPAVALMAAVLPGVELAAFYLDPEAPSVPAVPAGTEPPQFVLLADPFTFDAERFVRALDVAFPGSRTVGGLASGGRQPGTNALFLGRRVHRGGCVGVALAGDVAVDAIVAQGCRPIGEPAFVTRCERNLLYELDGRRAARALRCRRAARAGALPGLALPRHRHGRGAADLPGRRLPHPQPPRPRSAQRRAGGGRGAAAGHDRPAPPARCGCLRPRAAHAPRRAPRARPRAARWRAPLFLPRPRPPPLRDAGPRHRAAPRRAGRGADRRVLLQRRDRPRARADVPARLHERLRALPPAGLTAGYSTNAPLGEPQYASPSRWSIACSTALNTALCAAALRHGGQPTGSRALAAAKRAAQDAAGSVSSHAVSLKGG